MRLNTFEIASIKEAFAESFGRGDVYLFGSRTDDGKRGGDIDLYLCPSQKQDDEKNCKRKFLVKLESLIGEQKIDAVLQKDPNRTIEKVAQRDGIKL